MYWLETATKMGTPKQGSGLLSDIEGLNDAIRQYSCMTWALIKGYTQVIPKLDKTATRLWEDGYDIRTIQKLLGHSDFKSTMIYTHILNRGGRGVRSPADAL